MYINTGKDLLSDSIVTRIFVQETQNPLWSPADRATHPQQVWAVTAERGDKPPVIIASCDHGLVEGEAAQKEWATEVYNGIVKELSDKDCKVLDIPTLEIAAYAKYKGDDKVKKFDLVTATPTADYGRDGSAAPLTTKDLQEENGTVPDGEKLPDGFWAGVKDANQIDRVAETTSGQTAEQEQEKRENGEIGEKEANDEDSHGASGSHSSASKNKRNGNRN